MLPEFLDGPRAIALLTVVLTLALRYQRGVTWPEYRLVQRAKTTVFPVLDRLSPAGFRSFMITGDYRDDPDYLTTDSRTVRQVWSALTATGSPHLIASVKRRDSPYGQQYAVAHVLWPHDDGRQTEAFLFRNPDGSTDVYAHEEPAIGDPETHLEGEVTAGDPRGVVTDALEESHEVDLVTPKHTDIPEDSDA